MAATVGPILGGVLAGVFATQELSLNLQWASEGGGQWVLPAISLRGLDFLFLLSFVMGLYALHRLLAVEEKGEVEEKVVVGELFTEVRKGVRHVSNVAGLRHLTYFPYYFVKTAARTVAGRNGNATPESQTEENGPQTE
jgi:MFS family permease